MSDEAIDEPTARPRVLVADDEESMRYAVRRGLRRHGYDVEVAEDGAEAIAKVSTGRFDAVVCDLKMPRADGLAVVAAARQASGDSVSVLMTAHATVETAVNALRIGADDYVLKPFEIDEVVVALEKGFETRALRRENRTLRAQLAAGGDEGFEGLVGRSALMSAVFENIERFAAAGRAAHVLLGGESGTGKELAARAIHLRSMRRDKPFLVVPCATLPADLVESELFGFEAGAFTGADRAKAGVLRRADGGSVLLDEVAQMPVDVQAKIERFLETREFMPIGGDTPTQVDVRVLAATNRSLADLVEQGSFRRELYFRLDVLRLEMPPLRERRDDVSLLMQHFLSAIGGAAVDIGDDVMAALASYEWPGNVRELRNLAERLAVMVVGRPVELEDLPAAMRGAGTDGGYRAVVRPEGEASYEQARERFDLEYFESLMQRSRGNVAEAARRAGLSRTALHRRLAGLGLDPDTFRV